MPFCVSFPLHLWAFILYVFTKLVRVYLFVFIYLFCIPAGDHGGGKGKVIVAWLVPYTALTVAAGGIGRRFTTQLLQNTSFSKNPFISFTIMWKKTKIEQWSSYLFFFYSVKSQWNILIGESWLVDRINEWMWRSSASGWSRIAVQKNSLMKRPAWSLTGQLISTLQQDRETELCVFFLQNGVEELLPCFFGSTVFMPNKWHFNSFVLISFRMGILWQISIPAQMFHSCLRC